MKKVIITTIIAAAVTILLLSAVGEPQIQAERPERRQSIITTTAVTTALEAKEKNDNGVCDNKNHNEHYNSPNPCANGNYDHKHNNL